MLPPREPIPPVQAVPSPGRANGADFEPSGSRPSPIRQAETGERSAAAAAPAPEVEEVSSVLGEPALQRTRVAIERDDESGKLLVRIKDAATGKVVKQLPPEEFLRIARSIEKYLGLIVDKRS